MNTSKYLTAWWIKHRDLLRDYYKIVPLRLPTPNQINKDGTFYMSTDWDENGSYIVFSKTPKQ